MVRFKVIRGSHLLLALSALILTAVVIFILLQSSSAGSENISTAKDLNVQADFEAKAYTAFASNPSVNSMEIQIIKDKPDTPPLANAPRILIYHTHTHEAYQQIDSDPYEELESWRTADIEHSVVRVGAALEDALSKHECFVMHDTTDHELDDVSLSYVRALETLESYTTDFDLIIDLHRDAYSESLPLRLEDGDEPCAQIMLLVGDGGEYSGSEAPNYEKNLSFAQHLTGELNQNRPGIARNVTVKKGRFNQHMGNTAVLIEVGHNQNTLNEALETIPFLAKSIVNTLNHRQYRYN